MRWPWSDRPSQFSREMQERTTQIEAIKDRVRLDMVEERIKQLMAWKRERDMLEPTERQARANSLQQLCSYCDTLRGRLEALEDIMLPKPSVDPL